MVAPSVGAGRYRSDPVEETVNDGGTLEQQRCVGGPAGMFDLQGAMNDANEHRFEAPLRRLPQYSCNVRAT